MKRCNGCHKGKDESEFSYRVVNGKRYLRTQCRKCESRKRFVRPYSKEATGRAQARYSEKIRHLRLSNFDTARWILRDSRGSDKKNGRRNDLDAKFVESTIKNGCSYCGETAIRMTLDRIDNEKGHIRNNVVPACIRCNYARRNMPYKAWVVVARGMRKARKNGLFGNWTGRIK